MPNIKINGTPLTKVEHVSFSISGGGGEVTPTVTCSFSMPATEDTTLVEWMLAKQSPDRYRKVVIETLNRDGTKEKEWTLHKCYISAYSESEDAMGHSTSISATLIGVLASNMSYDGRNILEVKRGQNEKGF